MTEFATDVLLDIPSSDELLVTMNDAAPVGLPRRGQKPSLSDQINSAMIRKFYHARCCVYFIGNCRAVKIGVSQEFLRRLGEIDRGYEPVQILLLLPGDYKEERELHERFSELLVRKEWFLHTGELAEFITRERAKFL